MKKGCRNGAGSVAWPHWSLWGVSGCWRCSPCRRAGLLWAMQEPWFSEQSFKLSHLRTPFPYLHADTFTPHTCIHWLLGPKTVRSEQKELFPPPRHALPVAGLDVRVNSNSRARGYRVSEFHATYDFPWPLWASFNALKVASAASDHLPPKCSISCALDAATTQAGKGNVPSNCWRERRFLKKGLVAGRISYWTCGVMLDTCKKVPSWARTMISVPTTAHAGIGP